MEGRRRGGGAGASTEMVKCVFLLVVLALRGRGASGLDADGELLMAFRRAVTADPLGALGSWSYSDDSPCDWNGVICNGFPQRQQASTTLNLTSTSADGSGNGNRNFSTLARGANGTLLGLNASMAAATVSRVIGLVLPGAQLSGSLPAELARVEHLRHLDLSGNALNGTLPAALLLNATELRVLSLAGNGLSGALPDASYARGLQELNLSDNALAGWLPAALLRAPGLAVLGLANNYLAGELPAGGLGWLEVVDLSNNYFRGALPVDFGGPQLRFLNVSSNSLTGTLPARLSDVVPANTTVDLSNNNFTGAVPPAGPFAAQPAAAYEGNPGLCGPPLKHACSIPSSLSNPPNATDSPPAFAAIPKSAARAPPGSPEAQAPRGGQGKLKPLVILAIVAGDLAGVGLLFMLFMYVYHIRKKRREENPTAQQHKSIGGGAKASSVVGTKEDRGATSRGCCIGGGKNDGSDSSDCSASSSDAASDDGGGEDPKKRAGSYIGWGTPQHHSKNKHEQQQKQAPAPATLVTVDGGDGELEMETLLKASAYILGATGSSIVYKAVLADGTALAVRRIGESGGADKLKDFEAQVRAVARFRHPNILRLRGFYWGADEKLLIHDYAANGSLANVAFTRCCTADGTIAGGINKAGVDFYNSLIDEVLARGLMPFVTMFHFDTPQALEDKYGSFLSDNIVKDYVEYAELCFKLFGDRVKFWTTFNEPMVFCAFGYGTGTLAPGRCSPYVSKACGAGDSSTEPYIAGHNLLIAHAEAVHLYRTRYQPAQRGQIGIVQISHWFIPYDAASDADRHAVKRSLDFMLGWFMHPVAFGEYPATMRRLVGRRLPEFTKEQSEMLKGSYDFLGLNYYTSNYAQAAARPPNRRRPSYATDHWVNQTGYRNGVPIGPPAFSPVFLNYPPGLRELLLYIRRIYGNRPIYITENGTDEANNSTIPIKEALKDDTRISFHVNHLKFLHKAIQEGVNVKGYITWTFQDDFEFGDGFKDRFGLIYVDRATLARYRKKSSYWMQDFLKRH